MLRDFKIAGIRPPEGLIAFWRLLCFVRRHLGSMLDSRLRESMSKEGLQ